VTSFFLVVIISGQLAHAFGPGPGSAYAFESKAQCEQILEERVRPNMPPLPPQAKVMCIPEATFDRLAKGERVDEV
jgi:hypothetical protein